MKLMPPDHATRTWAFLIGTALAVDAVLIRHNHRTLTSAVQDNGIVFGIIGFVLLGHFARWWGKYDPLHIAAKLLSFQKRAGYA